MEELLALASRCLSRAVAPAEATAWVEGLLRGRAALLLHARALWAVLDTWVAALAPDTFTTMLPLLRRAFSAFEAPERRAMGELVRQLRGGAVARTPGGGDADLDQDRAARVMPVLAHILGVPQ
jgi:hypothetical protein